MQIDSATNASRDTTVEGGPGKQLTTIADVVREARRRADTSATSRDDLTRWLIIIAAIFGGLMLMRMMRRVTGFAFGMFWLWFWTHGTHAHFF